MDVADRHPSASIIATDISPIQPSYVPSNLQFEIDDFESEWTFPPNSFDFIHARCLYGCVADYPKLYKEAYDALKPGAYFEQAEISVISKSQDGSIAGTEIEKWGPLAIQCGVSFGKSFSIAEDSEQLMKAAGFEDVTCHTFNWPVGPWPRDKVLKRMGQYNRLGWEEGIEGWGMFLLTNCLGVCDSGTCVHKSSC
jgi:SAM-dependent methyltransferase